MKTKKVKYDCTVPVRITSEQMLNLQELADRMQTSNTTILRNALSEYIAKCQRYGITNIPAN